LSFIFLYIFGTYTLEPKSSTCEFLIHGKFRRLELMKINGSVLLISQLNYVSPEDTISFGVYNRRLLTPYLGSHIIAQHMNLIFSI